MKTLCIADFDDTLILTDSLVHIMKKEKWYLRPALIGAGGRAALNRLGKKIWIAGRETAIDMTELRLRSSFKKLLLEYYYALSEDTRTAYVSELRQKINDTVIEDIKSKSFDRIVIVSASEAGLVEDVLGDKLPDILIIANSLPDIHTGSGAGRAFGAGLSGTDAFETCYGANKVKRLKDAITDYTDYEISVYTDSWSDRPLIDIASHAYMVDGEKIGQVK